ncbi:hypothetical protein MKK60_17930, partial [Methylobacterium sp. J-092]|nr:hypothetical protein [Methylobacterium sp. J-092]
AGEGVGVTLGRARREADEVEELASPGAGLPPGRAVRDRACRDDLLDVSVQAQVLDLLEDLKQRLNLAMLFITHDLRVAAKICDRIAVMHRG